MPKRRKIELPVGCWIILILPLIVVAAPFVLTFEAIKERLQRCPTCGRRGTLERVHLEPPPDVLELGRRGALVAPAPEEGQAATWLDEEMWRINPGSVVWQCRACGARFRQDKTLTPINL